ncbi:MAG: hypothetical protein ABIS14_12750 [Sphingomonas sp.]
MIVGTIERSERGSIVLHVAGKPGLRHPLRGPGANANRFRADVGKISDAMIGRKIVVDAEGHWRLLEMVQPGHTIHDRTEALNLRVVTYTNRATPSYQDSDGRSYWIPRDAVARDGTAGIFYRISEGERRDVPGATYDFDGWEPWADVRHCGTSFGSRHPTYESALAWLEALS